MSTEYYLVSEKQKKFVWAWSCGFFNTSIYEKDVSGFLREAVENNWNDIFSLC